VPVGACICPDAHCSATDGPAHHFGLCCAVSISLAKQQQWFSFCVLQARWSGSLRHACHDSAKRAQLVCGPQMHTFFPQLKIHVSLSTCGTAIVPAWSVYVSSGRGRARFFAACSGTFCA
jgi:hypothetical protein